MERNRSDDVGIRIRTLSGAAVMRADVTDALTRAFFHERLLGLPATLAVAAGQLQMCA
mgnify:CR=1 FL=1